MCLKNNSTAEKKFSLKYFRVVWECGDTAAELILRVNRQLSQATERNRIKRIVREFFRNHKKNFRTGRWVFIAKRICEQATNRELFCDLEQWLAKTSHLLT